MYPTLYRGSVKDLLGPVTAEGQKAVIFEYTDAYSIFDWGKMPDSLPRKGEALAVIAAELFERLEKPENWKEFSRTPAALALRKGNRFGASFNEIGEELQSRGLRTHYIGVLPANRPAMSQLETEAQPARLNRDAAAFRQMVVRQVSVVKPSHGTVLGRSLPDYYETRRTPPPRLVPLEVVFRYSCPPGSSLFERVERDPGYLSSIGFGDWKIPAPGETAKWDFPVLELFTKLETTDRPVTLPEAMAISGLSAPQLQRVLLTTAWIAGFLKSLCANAGLDLADGKLEWGIDEKGEVFLVDAIGPDELRLLRGHTQLSKEFLRNHYRDTDWYRRVNEAKAKAKSQGINEWKRLVAEGPPPLSPQMRELGSQLYMALANAMTGHAWFPNAWPLEKVTEGIGKP